MNKSQKLAKVFFVFAIILLLIFSIKFEVNAAEDIYTETSTAKSGDIVYFEKPSDWGNYIPYIYAWDNNDPQGKLNGTWPGTSMTQVEDNLYKYEFQDNTPYEKIIFHNNNGTQTPDLDYICNGFIYTEKTIPQVSDITFTAKTLYSGDTVCFEKPESWDSDVFVYFWNSYSGKENSSWGSTHMTNESGNLYSYTLSSADNNVADSFDMVIFAAGSQQTKNLSTVDTDLIFIGYNEAMDSGNDSGKFDGVWVYNSASLSTLSTLVKNTTLAASEEDYYTEASYKIYKEQFDLAKTLLASNYVSATYYNYTSQYSKSLIALQFAYDNLELDTTILSNKINEMKNVETSKYEQSLVDAFNITIKDAETILSTPDTLTVAKIKSAIYNMDTAYNNLVVDKSELEALINKAKNIDTTLYTEESIKTLLDSLTTATNTFENQNTSYTDVQSQITTLNNAISNLILKEKTNTNEDESLSNVEENKQEEVIQTNSNPYTRDIIFLLAGVLILAIAIFIITTLYLRKQKNK